MTKVFCWVCGRCGAKRESRFHWEVMRHCNRRMRRDWRRENVQVSPSATPTRKVT